MIKVNSSGRTGNKLCFFYFAKYISDITDMKFIPEKINGFKHTYYSHGAIVKNSNWLKTSDLWNMASVNEYNFFEHIKNHNGGIIVDHMLTKYNTIKDINIKKYLEIENEESFEKPKNEDLVFHIRLGDYKKINWTTDKNLFLNILDIEKTDNVIIITDSPNDSYLNEFKQKGCVVRSKDLLSDYVFLKNAKKMAISKSTFSWLAAYTSNADKIYFPLSDNKPPYLINPSLNDVDLRPMDKKEWIII